jgi:ssRNA-specific RNase YbeY (16S rRNA maturation enzyme)
MAHGLLHYCGYGDKKKEKSYETKEDEKIAMFYVKQ